MSDLSNQLGRTIARLRKQRGLSQREFARLVGRSETWLSQVERGARHIDRMSVLERLADALDVPVADLAPATPAAAHEAPSVAGDLALALASSDALTAVLAAHDSTDTTELADAVSEAWQYVHASKYEHVRDRLAARLPELESAARTTKGRDRRQAYVSLARAYHALAAVLSNLGEFPAAWVAADRGIAAAERTGDALLMAEGSFRLCIVFQSARHYTHALRTASSAIDALAARVEEGDVGALSLTGVLHLQSALAEARLDHADADADAAYKHLDSADELAGRVGRGRNDYGTEFGPDNATLHRVTVAVHLGDAGAALRVAEAFDASPLSPERQARHQLDVARAHTQRRNLPAAIDALTYAHSLAPEFVTGHPVVIALVTDLLHTEHGGDLALRELSGTLGLE
ncbi:MAG: helix-turn-helix domain-containing protein [Streptosporangiales bacterium]|nr:helix-turn-helix domain-containing protein [Streptosporangiales bacterium]